MSRSMKDRASRRTAARSGLVRARVGRTRPVLWALSVGVAAMLGFLLLGATLDGPPATNVVFGAASATPEAAPPDDGEAGAAPVVFVGVSVIPMDRERILRDQTVVVRDGRIVRIDPEDRVELPEDAIRVDGTGRYLMPGLAEMHAHVPPQGGPGDAYTENVLFLYLANGVTTIRGMLGAPAHLDLREKLAAGEITGPRLITSGPSISGRTIPDPDSARRAVIHQKQAGYDFLKIHPGLTVAAFDAVVATADSVGIPFAGHISSEVGLHRALEAGQATIDHLDQYMEALVPEGAAEGVQGGFFGSNLVGHVDVDRIPEVAEATREAGVWNVPTQSFMERVILPDDPEEMARWPEMRYMPPQMVESWVETKRDRFLASPDYSAERAERFVEIRLRIIGALHEAGAGLLLGSDAPQIFQVPGFSLEAELESLVAAGLTPYEALATGTREIAVFFDEAETRGTVEEGKAADLVLLEANPLDDVGHVFQRAGVMIDGRWLPEEEIRERLEEIAAWAEEAG